MQEPKYSTGPPSSYMNKCGDLDLRDTASRPDDNDIQYYADPPLRTDNEPAASYYSDLDALEQANFAHTVTFTSLVNWPPPPPIPTTTTVRTPEIPILTDPPDESVTLDPQVRFSHY